MLYFAYGSNLNKKEMATRCPSAVYCGEAVIKNYELEFRYYLSIKENESKNLIVGVWNITDENDLKMLDFYEGFPQLYSKKMIKAFKDGSVVEGLIYIMNDNKHCYPHDIKPSKEYLIRCIEGYLDCKIDYISLLESYNRSR